MSFCPVCGCIKCGHTPKKRGQTPEEIARDLTDEEEDLYQQELDGSEAIIAMAKKNAHLPVE